MTTSIERIAEIIDDELSKDPEVYDALFGDEHVAISHRLRDDGRLMPDLPAPRTVDRYPGSVCWEMCADPTVAARRHVGVRVDHMRRIMANIAGEVTPDEAREAAYVLLAAADYVEQEQGHG